MSSKDPLLALRNSIKARYKPTPVDAQNTPSPTLAAATHIRLSDSLSLPKSTPTRLRRPGSTDTDPESSPSSFVSLEAVYLAWTLRDAGSAEYMKQARDNGLAVGFISVTERKGVVEWLEGKSSDLESIVPLGGGTSTPPGSPPQTAYYRTLPNYSVPSSSSNQVLASDSSNVISSSPTKRKYIPDSQDLDIVKKIRQNEVELRDRTTVLRGIKANNFASIRNVYSAKLKNLKESQKPGKAPAPAPTTSPDPKLLARKAKTYYPIIMISSSPTALITMHNVKRFLEESIFEPSTAARARATSEGNPRPEDLIPIYRKRTTIDTSGRETTTSQTYYVIDSAEVLGKFGADAWDRVVCVMTTGQAWQFRPYKWKEPLSLFHHVKGVYVSWSNDPPNPKIKDWNVTELKIDPHRRHVDKSTVAHFWKMLDTWTMHNKPSLMKS